MKILGRKIYLIIFSVLTIFTIYKLYFTYLNSVEEEFYQKYVKKYYRHDIKKTCKIPNYDPFDASIQQYMKKWPPIDCGKPQLPLTYLDNQGFINLNMSAIQESGIPRKHLHCMYQEVKRAYKDDYNIELETPEVFISREKLFVEHIIVQCYKDKELIYETGHMQILPLDLELDRKSKKVYQNGGVNVLLLGFDSMSRLNFIRQLPKTYKIVTEIYNFNVLKGLTKVGDNTLPNMIVLLSGLANCNRDRTLGPFINNCGRPRGTFDEYPLIWKNFSSRGYVTMLLEDHPEDSTFNYHSKGFIDQPTHYYPRPFWLAMDKYSRIVSKDDRCYGHVPIHEYFMNYTEQFINNMHEKNNAYFAFALLNVLSHDKLNSIQVIDDELSAFFNRFYTSGAMDNTLVLLFGDHGNRFDSFRKTVIGRVEERMPFLAIHVPKKLRHLRSNLEKNTNILTSWHDVYETLMDVAMNNTELKSKQIRYGYRGLSLFRAIPADRTCWQIGIPEEYCVCWQEIEVDKNDNQVVMAAIAIIDHVNKLLTSHSDMCAKLSLDSILSAQMLLPSNDLIKPTEFRAKLRVTIQSKPSGALLEAMTETNAWDSEIRIVGDVNRINAYGNQSSCIQNPTLQLHCFCKKIS